MKNQLELPDWYNNAFYDRKRTPEEWLFELLKRDSFINDSVGVPYSIYSLSIEEQENHFIRIVFDPKIEKLLTMIKATPPQPIKYPSVSDVFIMYHSLVNSDWYQKYPRRDLFENAISNITSNEKLTREQMFAFSEMHEAPWCAYDENYQDENWCPKRDIHHLTGIPVSVDPGYKKEHTSTVLKKKLTRWAGKLQDIRLQFDSWQERKILAVFDLRLWFKIKQISHSNIDLHRLIWPEERISKITGELVNPYDDIDHSISLADRAVSSGAIGPLITLCEALKYEQESNTD